MKAGIKKNMLVVLVAYKGSENDEVAKLLIGKKAMVMEICKGGGRAWVKLEGSGIQIPWPVEALEKFSS